MAIPQYETDQPVLYRQEEAIAWITLNRPQYGNAQNAQMLYALDDAFRRAADDEAIGAIVLHGAGNHFSGGHDIGTPGRDADQPAQNRRSLWGDHSALPGAAKAYVREQEVYLGLCRRWRDLPKPVIAAVHGACIAGGLGLAWIADLIIAADTAYFADPVVQMGIPGIEYFAHAIEMHPRAAREFLFLGDRMSAERGYQLGMVNRVVPAEQLLAEAGAIARRLAAQPGFALALAKQALNIAEDQMGKRQTMDAVYHIHHLAHAQVQLTTGHYINMAGAPKVRQRGGQLGTSAVPANGDDAAQPAPTGGDEAVHRLPPG